ncbi:hypothetical protein [Luedemannella helvata]|uniref:Uncharacterized protein n=1 Tax=Luedemannella helvata TaxID=349315 RepID=A0ABN2JQU5_9ACTN
MTGVDTTGDVLALLIRRYAFREIAALLGAGLLAEDIPPHRAAVAQQLCAYGQRLFDLDGEDLANPDAATGANLDTSLVDSTHDHVPAHLIRRGAQCRMPQSPDEEPRAALRTLVPAYQLVLEVVAARWRRHETASLLAALHIASQYSYLLAWERALGHAGDPTRLVRDETVVGLDSRFGVWEATDCPHTRPERAAASRALRVSRSTDLSWRNYLDRQHSTMARALGVCAANCMTPCTVMGSRREAERVRLGAACRAAFAFAESAVIRMRHAAPVGHGFGLPSRDEVATAWQGSRIVIARHGEVAAAVLAEDGFPLPGLPSLLSGIAGRRLRPDTLLADTAAEITARLTP